MGPDAGPGGDGETPGPSSEPAPTGTRPGSSPSSCGAGRSRSPSRKCAPISGSRPSGSGPVPQSNEPPRFSPASTAWSACRPVTSSPATRNPAQPPATGNPASHAPTPSPPLRTRLWLDGSFPTLRIRPGTAEILPTAPADPAVCGLVTEIGHAPGATRKDPRMVETRCFAAGSCKVEFRAAPETVSLRHLPATAARSRPAPAPVLPLRNRNKPRLPQAHSPSREPSLCPPKPAENRRRCPATGRPPQPAGKGVPRTGAPAPAQRGRLPGARPRTVSCRTFLSCPSSPTGCHCGTARDWRANEWSCSHLGCALSRSATRWPVPSTTPSPARPHSPLPGSSTRWRDGTDGTLRAGAIDNRHSAYYGPP